MKTNQYVKPFLQVLNVGPSFMLASSDTGDAGRDGYDNGGDPLNPSPSPAPRRGMSFVDRAHQFKGALGDQE